MIITRSEPQTEFSLGEPENLTIHNVQYWCHHTQKFAHSQVYKALKFVEKGCYEYVGEGMFICKNIDGYNSRHYAIKKNENTQEFDCNCQYCKNNDGAMCSHILGLYYAFKLKYFQKEMRK
jgi:hypothetical protein